MKIKFKKKILIKKINNFKYLKINDYYHYYYY